MPARTPSEDAIREAAYYAWLNEGRPEGRALAHWEAAVAALAPPAPKKRRAAAKPKAAAKPRARKAAD